MSTAIKLSMIAAVASNHVIGVDNDLPWSLKDDLRHFMRTTKHHPVIMGRLTYESMGKPLPERTNIVLTRNTSWSPDNPNVHVVTTTQDAVELASKHAPEDNTAYIIGGGTIYDAFLPTAHELIITHVDAAPEGHAHFPEIDKSTWRKAHTGSFDVDDRNEHAFKIVCYERIVD